MYRRLEDGAEMVTLSFDGRTVRAPRGTSVAAAVLLAGGAATRATPVSGAPRAPYCMMGVCFDCLVEIDGVANRQACMVQVAEGMQVATQAGARGVMP